MEGFGLAAGQSQCGPLFGGSGCLRTLLGCRRLLTAAITSQCAPDVDVLDWPDTRKISFFRTPELFACCGKCKLSTGHWAFKNIVLYFCKMS